MSTAILPGGAWARRGDALGAATTVPPDLHAVYRPEIDGLRAIAVLAVVTYHAFPRWMPGGFVGVDVFFVISGFLISSIIMSAVRNGRFGFLDFYARRVKRIFPALVLVLVSVWIVGWFRLFSDEYRSLGKHLLGAATFLSNFLLRAQSGYFDSASETKPFLHLWSLAIEEQFYLLWPLVLAVLVARLRAAGTMFVTAAIAAASFAFNLALAGHDASGAFYSPLARIWELMVGALLAQSMPTAAPPRRERELASLTGLALIGVALLWFESTVPYPGWRALLPVVGTSLVIWAGAKATLNHRVLGSFIARWFGSISYPLYLWHWPLLSFAFIERGHWVGAPLRAGLVVVAIALAWGTDRLIERPVRASRDLRWRPALLATLMAVVGVIGFATLRQDGLAWRMGDRDDDVAHFDTSLPEMRYVTREDLLEKSRDECNFYDLDAWRAGRSTQRPRDSIAASCYTRPASARKLVLLWGDSHAAHLNYGLRQTLPADVGLLQVASSACPADVVLPTGHAADYCRKSNEFALATIARERPDVVVIAQGDGHSPQHFTEIADTVKSRGAGTVVVIGPIPQWQPHLNRVIARHFWHDTPDRLTSFLDPRIRGIEQRLRDAYARQQEPFVYVDLFDAMCNAAGCMTTVDGDRTDGLITMDYGHLTPRASVWLAHTLLTPFLVRTMGEAS